MAGSAARQLALNALQRWRKSREFADSIVQRLILGSEQSRSDRGFAQELFYGVLRNLTLLDFFIGQLRDSAIDDLSRDLLRLGLYQLFELRTPVHAAVFETVELASPHRRSLINGIMRNAVRERDRLRSNAAKTPLHIRESHPEFLVRRWREAFGENCADAICRWNNKPAPIYARINTLRIRPEDFLKNNPTACPISAHPFFVEYEGLPEAAIARGDCYIQDPSTALAVDLLEAQPGEMVLDACAAPGGKTLYLAAITKNTASIVACNRDAARLKLLRQNLSHLGAIQIEVIQHDWLGERYPAAVRPKQFDKILVDAPCTNTGVMRRRVDVLHASARRQIFRRNISPGFAVIARDMKRPVVRAHPNHALFERRLCDCVERAVKLFAGYVTRDRFAAGALATFRMRGEIRRDPFPRHAFVARAMKILRAVVQHVWIVRGRRHRRNSLKTQDQIAGGIAIQRLRTDPVILFLTNFQIHHAVLAFARSINDVRIVRMGHDWAGLASGTGAPIVAIVWISLAGNNDCGVVLLRAIELVRKLIVKPDAIDLRGWLIQLRGPGAPAIKRNVRAAVI